MKCDSRIQLEGVADIYIYIYILNDFIYFFLAVLVYLAVRAFL